MHIITAVSICKQVDAHFFKKKGYFMSMKQRISYITDTYMNLSELSRRAGLTRQALDKYKQGNREPLLEQLLRISIGGGINQQWLATGAGNARLGMGKHAIQISELLGAKKMSAVELSERSGLSLDELYQVMAGPSFNGEHIDRVAKALGVSFNDIAPAEFDDVTLTESDLVKMATEDSMKVVDSLGFNFGPKEFGVLVQRLYLYYHQCSIEEQQIDTAKVIDFVKEVEQLRKAS